MMHGCGQRPKCTSLVAWPLLWPFTIVAEVQRIATLLKVPNDPATQAIQPASILPHSPSPHLFSVLRWAPPRLAPLS